MKTPPWRYQTMSKYQIPIFRADCPACNEECFHRVTFEDKEVRHIRCELCSAVHVCASKGSFHARIESLDHAQVADAAEHPEADCYQSSSAFGPTDVFAHPSFGLGYVVEVLPPSKMEVLFADKVRVLVCGPGSGIPEPDEKKAKESRRKARR
tara:strand:+ start:10007 stop:10465 length:459 start_codon:yes stop_codon:yes gene_type:complete